MRHHHPTFQPSSLKPWNVWKELITTFSKSCRLSLASWRDNTRLNDSRTRRAQSRPPGTPSSEPRKVLQKMPQKRLRLKWNAKLLQIIIGGLCFQIVTFQNVKGLWLASQCCCQKLPGAATILDTSTLEFLIGFKRVIVWGCALVYSESNTRASKAIWRLFSGHNLSQKIRILCKKTQFKCVKEVPSGIRLWKEDAPSQVSVAGDCKSSKKDFQRL